MDASYPRFFLGANAPGGFVSRFDHLYSPQEGWFAYILKGGPGTGRSVFFWAAQLGLNFAWSLLFFNSGGYFSALLCLVLLEVMILAMAGSFATVSRLAARLQIPYLLWVAFAGCLNAAVWVLNW